MLKEHIIKNKSFYLDVFYSILASGLLTGVATFIVNPYVAKQFDASGYGLVLSLSALVTAVAAILGNTLNNVRLIENVKNDTDNLSNYRVIIVFASIVSTVVVALFNFFMYGASWITLLLLMVFALTATLKNYYIVVFRIKINTKRTLILAVIVSITYALSIFLPMLNLLWPLIYVFGEIVSLIFIRLFSEIPKEKFAIDKHLKRVLKTYFLIFLSSVVGNFVLYLDRFLIFPVLGPDSVTIYTVSTVYSKMFSIVLAPISGLILSYISQQVFKMTKKIYMIIVFGTLISGFMFLLTVPVFAPWFTQILYPQFYDLSQTYFLIGAIGVMISNISLIINPIVLRFSKARWQLYISILYGIVYFSSSIVLMKLFGLYGFYIAVIISNTFRGGILLVLSRSSLKNSLKPSEIPA